MNRHEGRRGWNSCECVGGGVVVLTGLRYTQPPVSQVDVQARPEDGIPDLPENQNVRAFLKSAPQQGLWMPLGKEVKLMQCWRCKAFGHRTGDRECPLKDVGNLAIESERQVCQLACCSQCMLQP